MAENTLFQVKKSVYDYLMSLTNAYNQMNDSRAKAAYQLLAGEYNKLYSIKSISELDNFKKGIEITINEINSKINKLRENYKVIAATNPTDFNLKRINREIRELRNQLMYYQIFLNKISIKEQTKGNSFPPLEEKKVQNETQEVKSTKFTNITNEKTKQTDKTIVNNTLPVTKNNGNQNMRNTQKEEMKSEISLSIAIAKKCGQLNSATLSNEEEKKIRLEIFKLCEYRKGRLSNLGIDPSILSNLHSLEQRYGEELAKPVKKETILDKASYIERMKKLLNNIGDLKIKKTKSNKYKKEQTKSDEVNQAEVVNQIKKNMDEFKDMINCLFGSKNITLIDGKDNNKYTIEDLIFYIGTYGFDMDFKEFKKYNPNIKIGNSELTEVNHRQGRRLINEMMGNLNNMISSKIDSLGGKVTIKHSQEEKENLQKAIFQTISDIYKTMDKNKSQGEQFVR